MKLQITMKTPDCISDTIDEAKRQAWEEVENECDRETFDEEMAGTFDSWKELCEKWFSYGECVTLEIDTEEETIRVLEVGK